MRACLGGCGKDLDELGLVGQARYCLDPCNKDRGYRRKKRRLAEMVNELESAMAAVGVARVPRIEDVDLTTLSPLSRQALDVIVPRIEDGQTDVEVAECLGVGARQVAEAREQLAGELQALHWLNEIQRAGRVPLAIAP